MHKPNFLSRSLLGFLSFPFSYTLCCSHLLPPHHSKPSSFRPTLSKLKNFSQPHTNSLSITSSPTLDPRASRLRMAVCRPNNPYAAMDVPKIEVNEAEAQHLSELHARDFQLLSEHISTEGLMVMIRDNDRAEASKLGLRRDSAPCVNILIQNST